MRVWLLTAVVLAVSLSVTAQPRDLWSHSAASPIGRDLLLGDFGKSIGNEIMYTLENPAKIVCLSPRGEISWDLALEGNQKVTGLVAGTGLLPQSDGLIAVGGEKDLVCIYAENGELYWREAMPGGLGVGGLMWLDIDGDFKEELLVATVENELITRTLEGMELWRYSESEHIKELKIVGAMAGGDINNDRSNEVILPLERSVVALDGDGVMVWESTGSRESFGSPVIADCDGNVFAEVYVLTQNPLGLLALDGDIGTERWFLPLDETTFKVEGGNVNILVADLEQDGFGEIVLSDGSGTVVAVGKDGKEKWRNTLPGGCARLSAADLDGDLRVELLVSSADGTLCQLGPWGEIEWTKKYAESFLFAPVISDVNRDAVPDIVVVDDVSNVICLRTNENYVASLMLWPMARQTLTRDGYARNLSKWKTSEGEHLLNNAEFEYALETAGGASAHPVGWKLSEGVEAQWGLGDEHKRDGKSALWVDTGSGPATVHSVPLPLPVGVKSLSGGIQGWGAQTSRVYLQWFDKDGVQLREDTFSTLPSQEGWTRFGLNSTKPPEGVLTVAFTIESKAAESPRVWWDTAQLEADVSQPPVVEVLHNQVAYESYAPKKFVVRSNWKAKDAHFAIVNDLGESLYEADLTWGVRFKAGGDTEWPGHYWRGDFSEFHEQGSYRIVVDLDGERVVSAAIEVGNISLWNRVSSITVGALSASLCGGAEGAKAAWRTELDGGVLHTPELFWELAQVRRICAWRLEKIDVDKNAQDDLLQMLLAVGKGVAATIKEDGSSDLEGMYAPCGLKAPSGIQGDSAVAAMGLARLAEQTEELAPESRQNYIDAASRALDWCLAHELKGPMQFNTAVDLYLATKDAKYEALAHELFPELDFSWVADALSTDAPESALVGDTMESVLRYESSLTENTLSLYQSVEAGKAADDIVNRAKNPFGVFMYSGNETLQCFAPADSLEKVSGHTRHILDAAAFVAQVYRFQPKAEYHAFIYDQLNWLMGCNPFGLCLVTGPGKRISPRYNFPVGLKDNRIAAGMLPRGPVAMGPGDDRPLFEVERANATEASGNEVDLYNTVALLKVMANIKRMPVGPDDL